MLEEILGVRLPVLGRGSDGDRGDCRKIAVMKMMVSIVIVVMVVMKATNTHWLPVQFQGERHTHISRAWRRGAGVNSHLQMNNQRLWEAILLRNSRARA